jgi:hypothetical protein
LILFINNGRIIYSSRNLSFTVFEMGDFEFIVLFV